nr:hypothetical protein [Bradyrhizobium diazoefficiens]
MPAIGTYYVLSLPAAHFPEIHTAVYAGQLRDIRRALHVGAVGVRGLGGIALAAASIWVVKFYLARSRALRGSAAPASSRGTGKPGPRKLKS